MKSLILKNLQEACSGFQIAACDFKSCSESRLGFWKLLRKPARTCTAEKIEQGQRRKAGTEILKPLLEQYLKI
jgi:hypothetical protein